MIPALRTASVTNKEFILFAIVIIIGLSAAGYLYSLDKYSLLYYGDSTSHLVGARKIIDWQNPGPHQIGTVWLPLPHLLLLPFSLMDPLFRTGFAGLVVSLPSLAITSVFLYRIIKLHTGLVLTALVVALLYATNPNILYMGITAMTEAPFMLFFVASAYYFHKWYQNTGTSRLRELAKCSIFVSLATLSRYEAWFIPIFLILFVLVVAVREKSGIKYKSIAILISTISLSGIAIWLIWNAYYYNDPLEFANAQYYSATSQALMRPDRENLFLQPLNVASIYGLTALAMYGPVLLAAAVMGYIFHRRLEGRKERRVLYTFLVLPPILTVVSLIAGVGEMNQWWFNARFLIPLSPLIILLVSVMILGLPSRIRKNNFILGSIIAIMFVYQFATPAFEVVTFIDARNGFFYKTSPFSVQTGEALGSLYDGGRILLITGSAQEHRIMLSSGIPLREFNEGLAFNMGASSFREPWSHVRWIVTSSEPSSDGVKPAEYWLDRQGELSKYFDIVYESQYHKIMLRR